jgi:OOP family OmpA-OmpF porin
MSDSPLRIVPNTPPDSTQPEGSTSEQNEPRQDELAELRRLLIEPEQVQIKNIIERLNNSRMRAREQSRSLPEAIRLRAAQDKSLSEALTPTIVTAFQSSVKKDPRPIVDAISPILGPAIRRAISNALNQLIQSLDQVLKHSFSWQGFKWRLEAFRTGKSFAEVVLYHTLVYRVEQVFLIHRETGLLLQHVAASSVSTKDADIVSGMLTVIQDAIRKFVRDAFGGEENEMIEKLDLGDIEVWIEPGPRAILAAVVRGNASEELRSELFAPALEAIHSEQRETLDAFDGDVAPFFISRHHLEYCLQSRYQAQTDPAVFKIPAYIWVVTAMILAALVIWAFFNRREQWRWDDYIAKLKSTPGIVVVETGKQDGKFFVAGLRDPLAANPNNILREQTELDPNSVTSRWDRYQALDPQFVNERVKKILKPPQGVELNIDNGVLKASGIAPYQWIVDSRILAPAIPGVDEFNDESLINEDLKEPELLRRQIENRVIRFVMGTAELIPGENRALSDLISELKKLIALAPAVGRSAQIRIIGHTDSEGDENTNLKLSRDRASQVLSLLTARGINKEFMSAIGVGTKEPVRPEVTPEDKQYNRSVSFKVVLVEAPHRKVSRQ